MSVGHGHFGCQHFKINMGRRSPRGTSDEDSYADKLRINHRFLTETLKVNVHWRPVVSRA